MWDEETEKNEMKGKELDHPKGRITLGKLFLVSSRGEFPLRGGRAIPPGFLPHPHTETGPVAFRRFTRVPLINKEPRHASPGISKVPQPQFTRGPPRK